MLKQWGLSFHCGRCCDRPSFLMAFKEALAWGPLSMCGARFFHGPHCIHHSSAPLGGRAVRAVVVTAVEHSLERGGAAGCALDVLAARVPKFGRTSDSYSRDAPVGASSVQRGNRRRRNSFLYEVPEALKMNLTNYAESRGTFFFFCVRENAIFHLL